MQALCARPPTTGGIGTGGERWLNLAGSAESGLIPRVELRMHGAKRITRINV